MNIQYSDKIEQIRKLRAEAAALAKDAISAGFKEIFDAHPRLEMIKWSQYTPYFMDGAECVFSVNADYPQIKLQGDEFPEEYYPHAAGGDPEGYAISEKVSEVVGGLEPEDMKTLFGDHVFVNAYPDRFEVEDCEHD